VRPRVPGIGGVPHVVRYHLANGLASGWMVALRPTRSAAENYAAELQCRYADNLTAVHVYPEAGGTAS
jgi:hypothetical protein